MLAQTTSSSMTKVWPGDDERCVGQGDEARQHRGHAHAGESRASLNATVTATFMLRLARNGSGRPGLERERRQHRGDVACEDAGQVRRDVGRPRRAVEQANAGLFERAAQVVPDVEPGRAACCRARACMAPSCCSVL